jgi:hypothetical protein
VGDKRKINGPNQAILPSKITLQQANGIKGSMISPRATARTSMNNPAQT